MNGIFLLLALTAILLRRPIAEWLGPGIEMYRTSRLIESGIAACAAGMLIPLGLSEARLIPYNGIVSSILMFGLLLSGLGLSSAGIALELKWNLIGEDGPSGGTSE